MLIGSSTVHLGVGDPDLQGWSIAFGYVSAAALCFMRSRYSGKSVRNGHAIFWMLLAIFLFLMGINKQLDLQTILIGMGKQLSIELGLYEQRRTIVIAFVSLLLAWGLASQAWLYSVLDRMDRFEKTALLGLGVLFAFIAVRAAFFQHIDLLANSWMLTRRIHALMEIAGMSLIGGAAFFQIRKVMEVPSTPYIPRPTLAE